MEKFEFTTDELVEAATRICELGQDMGYRPDHWAIIISMVAKNLSDAQGIEVNSERRVDA